MRNNNVVHNTKIIPEFISGSSTQAVKQHTSKTLKKFQGLSFFTTTQGFTLIELLVVVLIIGILAAVAVPQYQKAVWKSRAVEAIQTIHTLQKAISVYRLGHTNDTENVSFLGTGANASLDIELGNIISCDEISCSTKHWRYDAGCEQDSDGMCYIFATPLEGQIYSIESSSSSSIWGDIWARYCGSNETQRKYCEALQGLGGVTCEGTSC